MDNKEKDDDNKIVEIEGFEFLFNDDDLLIIEDLKKKLNGESDDDSE